MDNKCPKCGGEGWHLAPMDSAPDRLVWNSCMVCNQDGHLKEPPRLTEEEARERLRKLRGY